MLQETTLIFFGSEYYNIQKFQYSEVPPATQTAEQSIKFQDIFPKANTVSPRLCVSILAAYSCGNAHLLEMRGLLVELSRPDMNLF